MAEGLPEIVNFITIERRKTLQTAGDTIQTTGGLPETRRNSREKGEQRGKREKKFFLFFFSDLS